jgi:hypothetical protein
MQQGIFNSNYNLLCEAAINDAQYPNMGVSRVLIYSSQCNVCEHVLHGHNLDDNFSLSDLINTIQAGRYGRNNATLLTTLCTSLHASTAFH